MGLKEREERFLDLWFEQEDVGTFTEKKTFGKGYDHTFILAMCPVDFHLRFSPWWSRESELSRHG